ncbi:MAG: rod shape-determining protein MreC, partial [Eubacteriales bacterium]|nr:rod shape-determining protein MreC [Eubacteriales bacterium]
MREMLSSKSFKKFICVMIAIVLVMGISAFSDTSVVSSFLSSVTLGLQEVSAAASKELQKDSYDDLLRKNEELSDEVADLRTQLVDYYEVKEENARLWKYYDLKKNYPSYELLPASVLRRDPSDSYYSFTADKGRANGVSVGDPVVTEKGIIGWVSAVDLCTCRVKTILSPDAKVGSIDAVSRDSGIVSGSIKYASKNLTTMTKLPAQNTMQAGDIVITTGISGLYPPSMIVGEVVKLDFDEYDTSTYAVIKPYEDIRTVTDVVIITSFDGQGEISKDAVEDATLPTEETAPAVTT